MKQFIWRRWFLVALSVLWPVTARGNPVSIDGTSLLAFCIVAFWAFVLEAGVVGLLLAFRGLAPLRVFAAYFITNVLVFFLLFQPLLGQGRLSVPVLELVVVLIDGFAIKFLANLNPLQGDGYSRVGWWCATIISACGNATSYFVGYIASQKPWIQH